MKKILSILALIIFSFSMNAVYAKCGDVFNGDSTDVSLNDALNDCTPKGAVTSKIKKDIQIGGAVGKILGGSISASKDSGDYNIRTGAKERIISFVQQLMIVGGILAVAGIVVSAILMTLALGDDKKLGDAKNGLKYSVVGFLVIVIAFPLVNGVVNFVYTIVGS